MLRRPSCVSCYAGAWTGVCLRGAWMIASVGVGVSEWYLPPQQHGPHSNRQTIRYTCFEEDYQFKDAIVKRITKMVMYDEERIILDCYDIAQSLKQKTRAKRAQGKEMTFAIHDEFNIAKITLKELLSASKTKTLLLNILGNSVLEEYKGWKRKVVVVKGITVQINQPHCMRRQTA